MLHCDPLVLHKLCFEPRLVRSCTVIAAALQLLRRSQERRPRIDWLKGLF